MSLLWYTVIILKLDDDMMMIWWTYIGIWHIQMGIEDEQYHWNLSNCTGEQYMFFEMWDQTGISIGPSQARLPSGKLT